MKRILPALLTLLLLTSTSIDAQYVYDRQGHVYNSAKTGTKYGGVFENGFAAMGDSAIIMLPDTTFSATATPGGTGFKVIIGSLRNVVFVGEPNPVARWRQLEKNTSWHAGSGMFPLEYVITISNGQDSVIVWDRLKATRWMVFSGASINNMCRNNINDVKFSDGHLYLALGNSLGFVDIDFLRDKASDYNTGAVLVYGGRGGNIDRRNSGDTWVQNGPSISIVNNTVNAVTAIRDPYGGIDEFGRYKHRVLVGTGTQLSLSDAGITTFYNSNLSGATGGITSVEIFPDGAFFATANLAGAGIQVTDGYLWAQTKGASFTPDVEWAGNGTGAGRMPWPNNTATNVVRAIPNASASDKNSPIVIIGANPGLVVSHSKRNSEPNGLTFVMNSRALWPVYSATADSIGWPFDSPQDTINVWGKKISRAGTGAGVTYGAGVIGQAAILDGSANGYFTRLQDNSLATGTSAVSWMIWFKASSFAGTPTIWMVRKNGEHYQMYLSTVGVIHFNRRSNGGAIDADIVGPTIGTSEWHFAVMTFNDSTLTGYLDGEPVGSASTSGTVNSDSLVVGRAVTGFTNPFTGSVDQWQKIPRALTAQEIRWLYNQGLHGLQSNVDPYDALHNDAVNYVSVDPSGHWIAAGTTDSVTIFDEYFIPKYRYAAPNGSIKSVALWTDAGADSLSHAIGTTTRLKLQQTDLRIAELARQGSGPRQDVAYWPHTVVTPADSGTMIFGGMTVTPADSIGKFKYAGPMSGDFRVGRNAEVRGALRYGSASAVGADVAEMFATAETNYRVVIVPVAPDKKEIFAPALIRASTVTISDNDSTRTYPFTCLKSTETERARLLLDAGRRGRTGAIAQSIVYARGVKAGDLLWYRPDTSTVVKVPVTLVMGDTVSLASVVPKETEFTIYPPNLLLKFTGSRIQAGDVVQIGPGKTMQLSQAVGKKGWVVSTSPANVLNADLEGVPVALVGSVPCVVAYDAVRGGVAPGDPLTAGINGVAVKALAGEQILGWAMEAVAVGTKKISVLVE